MSVVKVGRQLRSCGSCGRPTEGYQCKRCKAKNPSRYAGQHGQRPYNSPAYQVNRRQVIAEEKVCWICGEEFTPENPATADHIVSVRDGGSHHRDNLRACHRVCNSQRG